MIIDTNSRREVGQMLRKLRTDRGETAGEVEIRTGIKRNAIYNYELGYIMPSLPVFVKLVKHYGKVITIRGSHGEETEEIR